MISEQQLQYFHTFGFIVMKQVFTPDQMRTLQAEVDHRAAVASSYEPFEGTKRQGFTMMDRDTPFCVKIFEDDRIAGVAEQMYGPDVMGTTTDANRYVGNTNWHPDTFHIGQYGVKFAVYMQPVRADSGALRVIPGSHQNPLHDKLRKLKDEGQMDQIEQVPAHVCDSDPGDVVAFDRRTWYASCGGSTDRHMATFNFYRSPKTAEETAVTRFQLSHNVAKTKTSAKPWNPKELIPQSWLDDAENLPRRKRWIAHLQEVRQAECGLEVVREGMGVRLLRSHR